MRVLGQPCALSPLFRRGPFEAAGSSCGFRTGVARAGGAKLGFPSGQVQPGPSPAVQIQPSCKGRKSDSPRFLLCLWLESGQLRPVVRLLHSAAADFSRRESELFRVLRWAPSWLGAEAAGPHRLCSKGALQATRDFAVSGEGSRGASSDIGPRKATDAPSENDLTDPNQENKKKPNKSQQLKNIFKEYGAVGISFHVGISLMSLGMFYLLVSSGVDMAAILSKMGFNEALLQSSLAAGTSTFVLAYAIHKLFAPVRISITIISVPFLVRYFRKIGFFKPPAPNP